ncbi:hypothetical protein PanWU01x14_112020, partial [Parasponia andersonii]
NLANLVAPTARWMELECSKIMPMAAFSGQKTIVWHRPHPPLAYEVFSRAFVYF